MFFASWMSLLRLLLAGVLTYTALVLVLRVSGKRTLAKMNAFDMVVTVAFGSALSTVILSRDVPILEGIMAICLLVALQFMIAWLSVRSDRFERLVKTAPTLLFHHGRFLDDALREQRVARSEVLAAVRSEGFAALEDVTAVVLETDGTFSVVRGGGKGPATALDGVQGYEGRGAT